ncbi:unnamed protein product [Parajaminaea phylloscopi]
MKPALASPLLSLFSLDGRHSGATSSSAPSILIVRQTQVQSAAPIIHHLLHSAHTRGEAAHVLSTGRASIRTGTSDATPAAYYDLDGQDDASGDMIGQPPAFDRLLQSLRSASSSGQSSSVIIHTLDSVLDHYCLTSSDPVKVLYRQLQQAARILNSSSQLVLVASGPSPACVQPVLEQRLLDLISSPLFLKDSLRGGAGNVLQTIQLHPPVVWRHLLGHYGARLRPATTSSRSATRLQDLAESQLVTGGASTASTFVRPRDAASMRNSKTREASMPSDPTLAQIFDWDAQQRSTDPRLWSLLEKLGAEAAVNAPGSWLFDCREELEGEELEAIRPVDEDQTEFDPVSARITLDDLLGPAARPHGKNTAQRRRSGWGLITSQHRLPGGKFDEEIFGCIMHLDARGDARLRLVPLDMSDRRSAGQSNAVSAVGSAASGQEPSHSLLDSLPFNLSLTEEQKKRRDGIALPFAPTDQIYEGMSPMDEQGDDDAGRLRRGTTGQSTIYFEPDSGDEEDEEDPDDF